MSNLKVDQILKKDSQIQPKKLSNEKIKRIVKEVRDKQDFIISLKNLNEKDLMSVVQL